jgi:hypothetical protein
VYARALCSRHYQQARLRHALPDPVPASKPCARCGRLMSGRKSARAQFCSPTCKYAAQSEAGKAERVVARRGRICLECGGPIAPEASGKARTCSRACGVAWQNRIKAEKRRAEWLATKGPCRGCGADIPDDARAGSTFCSRQCQKTKGRALNYDSARARDYNRQYAYGITREQFDALLAAQDGKCAICGTSDWPGRSNRPHVDHCHTTGAVRGILCHFCNIGLGNFRDRLDLLQAAAAYLARTQ